jgi:hypothetical protein
MQKIKDFFITNKVFFIGLLSAIATVVQQYTMQNPDYKAIGLAVGLAILSYISNEWRGQGVTILGIVGILAGVIFNAFNSGTHITIVQLIGAILIAVLAAVAPPAKPSTYENSTSIDPLNTIQTAAPKDAEIQNKS